MTIKNIDELKEELKPYIKQLGHFPSRSFLKENGRDDLIRAIRNTGGVEYVAAALNVPTYNQKNRIHDSGYWTIERIKEEYIHVIRKHDLKEWPSPADLQELGHGALSAAIGIHTGGHIKFRKHLIDIGFQLKNKPRKLDHLQPFETLYPINDTVFEEGELKYYFLGIVAADGTIVSRKNEQAVELCLKACDIEILEKLRDRISPERPIHDKPSRVKEEYLAKRLKFNSKPLVGMVAEYMTINKKSINLTWAKNIPDEFLRHFIRGYFDGDGTIDMCRNQREFDYGIKYYYVPRLRFVGTKHFLTGMIRALERLTSIPAVKVHRKGKENLWYFSYSGLHARMLHDLMYNSATIYLKRKAALWKYILQSPPDELARIYGTEEGKLNKRAKEGELPFTDI